MSLLEDVGKYCGERSSCMGKGKTAKLELSGDPGSGFGNLSEVKIFPPLLIRRSDDDCLIRQP